MGFDGKLWEDTLPRIGLLLRIRAGQLLNPRHWSKVSPTDMVQKTLLEAHEKRADFRGSTVNELVAWLKIMLGHRVIDEVKKLQCQKNDADLEVTLERALTQLQSWTSPLSALVRHEDELRLAEALYSLPEEQRRAIKLVHMNSMGLAETAEFMGKTKGAIAGLLRRGQARLRELLKDSR